MNFRGYTLGFWIVFFLAVSPLSQGSVDPKTAPPLTQIEKNSLRYHLENLFNELDLIIKNRRVDLADLQRQEREMSMLKVYERIPLQRNLDGLKQLLIQSARKSSLNFISLKVLQYSSPGQPLPRWIYTDNRSFRLSQEQLVEQIRLKMTLQGSEQDLQNWIHQWPDHLIRIVVLDIPKKGKAMTKNKKNGWDIAAKTYRFREIKFPTLRPQNPRKFLPLSAQTHLELFSKKEPLLWEFVTKIESLTPDSRPYYENRSRFLLNDARLNFFFTQSHAFLSLGSRP